MYVSKLLYIEKSIVSMVGLENIKLILENNIYMK